MTRRRWIIALAVAVLVLVGAGGWWIGSARVAGDVGVTWSPGSPECEGTHVRKASSTRPIIEAKEGMRCVINVTVTNAGPFTVHVSDAGEAMTFDVVLVLHPEGCNAGGTFYAESWPTVTIEVLGRAHRLTGDTDFAFHRRGTTPGCSRG